MKKLVPFNINRARETAAAFHSHFTLMPYSLESKLQPNWQPKLTDKNISLGDFSSLETILIANSPADLGASSFMSRANDSKHAETEARVRRTEPVRACPSVRMSGPCVVPGHVFPVHVAVGAARR